MGASYKTNSKEGKTMKLFYRIVAVALLAVFVAQSVHAGVM